MHDIVTIGAIAIGAVAIGVFATGGRLSRLTESTSHVVPSGLTKELGVGVVVVVEWITVRAARDTVIEVKLGFDVFDPNNSVLGLFLALAFLDSLGGGIDAGEFTLLLVLVITVDGGGVPETGDAGKIGIKRFTSQSVMSEHANAADSTAVMRGVRNIVLDIGAKI